VPREEANNGDVHLTVKKIFIGGIREGIDENALRKHFEKYGNINDCLLMHDKDGKTRGFAFIEFDGKGDLTIQYRNITTTEFILMFYFSIVDFPLRPRGIH